ncbi:MAG: DUF11 domain-containing protein [Burkholderiaceae bacterium]|nr:DUF11 domain-containing protein [Burkholderiaceae bacterium]
MLFGMLVFAFLVQSAGAVAPRGGQEIRAQAWAEYLPSGMTQVARADSNVASVTVDAVAALQLSSSQSVRRPPGASLALSHLLTNTGNIPATYTLTLVQTGCTAPSGASSPSPTFAVAAPQLWRDANNNGVIDTGADTAIASGGSLTLAPGESASVLLGGSIPTTVASGNWACLSLAASDTAHAQNASNQDTVVVGNTAALTLAKTAAYPGIIVPGTSEIQFQIDGQNVGAQAAAGSGSAAGSTVLVDNVPVTLLLLRDKIPAGMVYVAGSLASPALAQPGALRLFRLASDPQFSYRQGAANDDASMAEVAIGLPLGLPAGTAMRMSFKTRVTAGISGSVVNGAQAYYNDGAGVASASSNSVVIPVVAARMGLAKAAGALTPGYDGNGAYDGTATVRFTFRLRNEGSATLYGTQISDVLEGAAANQFGTYTAGAPGAGQYTIAGVGIVASNTGASGVAANTAFTGQAGAASYLLAPGAILPTGSEITLFADVRLNLSGRTATLENSATATAATVAGGSPVISDISANGSEPDANGNGTSADDSARTPVVPLLPILKVNKTSAAPVRVTTGVYDIPYTITVTNSGTAPAPFVRVLDNLNCAFDMDKPAGTIASWSIVSGPTATQGQLTPSTPFGSATSASTHGLCDRDGSGNALLPTEPVFSVVDGTRSLAVGATEVIRFTVRAIVKPGALNRRTSVGNVAWVASYTGNTVAPSPLVQSGAVTNYTLLVDPQGVVYDSATRAPIAGAIVNVRRNACLNSVAGPITPTQIFGGTSPAFTYLPDGSVSMTTGADGQYQFFFDQPPTGTAPNDLCDYAISVTPPTGAGYTVPSTVIPPTAGTFASCGFVVPSSMAPQGSDPTTYHWVVRAGVDPFTNAVCETLHNHIPLDPPNASTTGLVLNKESRTKEAEFGDFVDYTLTLTNNVAASTVTGIVLRDTLPPGFAYVSGSSSVNGVVAADPQGGAGPVLAYALPGSLSQGASYKVRYRVRIGVGSPTQGEAVNSASATGVLSGATIVSNTASWRIRVRGGVFSDDAFAIGRVYAGCGPQDASKPTAGWIGVPGVRLFLEDGTSVTTDAEGRWSLYGQRPITHVAKVDPLTLPAGSRLVALDNRNAGDGDSRFLDLKKGEMLRADFLIDTCGMAPDAPLLAAVQARRKSASSATGTATQADALYKTRLDSAASQSAGTNRSVDVRGLAASGVLSAGGAGGGVASNAPAGAAPLIDLPIGALGGAAQANPNPATTTPAPVVLPDTDGGASLLGPLPAPGIVDLEDILPAETKAAGFLGLNDGDTLPSRVTNVRVKGPAGAKLSLYVNGEAISERRVGKRVESRTSGAVAWEYISIPLKPGSNELRLAIVDDFGNARADERIRVTAPDKLGKLDIDLPDDIRADGRTPVSITLRLTDDKGVPVTARTYVSVFTGRGGFLNPDLNPAEAGLQIAVEGGSAVLRYVPPAEPGETPLRVVTGDLTRSARMVLLPEQRPMVGVGIVEGVLDLSQRGAIALGRPGSANAFESELRSLSASGDSRLGARAAFYLKGTIKGDYLLTAAYDSDKTEKDTLFRDIKPDAYYPVYGDDSVRAYDAQSTQRLYVRVDKNRSFLLYGDFTTAGNPEVRQLSQFSRSLTGIKHQYEADGVRVTSFASRTTASQIMEEQPALGISGPYFLKGLTSAADLVRGSDKVEILVRDRNQPNVILSATAMGRYSQYTIDDLTGRLLFLSPVLSFDENFNPRSIRVTYEVQAGGPEYTVLGTDAQVRVADWLQLGAVAVKDDNPDNPRRLAAATALARLGERTVLTAEAVRTDSTSLKREAAGLRAGTGLRAELRHDGTDFKAQAKALRTSEGFDNAGGGATAGRTEVNTSAEYKLSDDTRLRAEAVYSRDAASAATTGGALGATASDRLSASVAAQHRLSENIVAEAAVRHGNQTGTSAGGFDYGQVTGSSSSSGNAGSVSSGGGGTTLAQSTTTVRGRLTARVPALPQAQVFGEIEQDVTESDHRAVALGASYALTERTRAYGRYEVVSSLASTYNLSGSQQRNVGLFGIESTVGGGRLYNEYRLADTDTGRTAQGAAGLRQTYRLNEQWRFTGGIEATRNLIGNYGGAAGGQATAVTTGAEYTDGPLRAATEFEVRNASDSQALLGTLGAAYRLDADWTVLGRSLYTRNETATTTSVQARQQIGLAWRPVGDDRFNALLRYEHKYEDIESSSAAANAISALGTAGSPGLKRTHIIGSVINWLPERRTQITGRYAVKHTTYTDSQLRSTYWAQLVHGRYLRDLTPDWDIGLQAGLLLGQGGAAQRTLGAEVGYQLTRNLWLSVGYNVLGLSDPDLTAGEYTSKGAYLRLRFKFDEKTFGLAAADAGTRAPSAGAAVAAATSAAPAGRATGLDEQAAARAALAPAPSATAANWKPGQPLPARVEWREDDIFQPGTAELAPAGAALVDALRAHLATTGVGRVELSLGHGDAQAATDDARSSLWLRRSATLRRALQRNGPREVSAAVDTQALRAPLAAESAAEPQTLAVAVTATARPAAAPTEDVAAAARAAATR